MNEIINQIDELKQMQQFPRFHLSKYFDDLKAQVDLKYALKLDEKDKYLEIISKIESFEEDAYTRWNNNRRINTYDYDIQLIEDKLNNNQNNLTVIIKLIGEVKYKIEKIMFSNKSISFIDIKQSRNFFSFSNAFLLVINDEYIQKNLIDNDDKYKKRITRKELIANSLKWKLDEINPNVVNLDIDILNLKETYFSMNKIEEIDSNFFNGLDNLKIIDFNDNKIKEIHPKLFNGLTNLEVIDFGCNQIKELDPNLFNELTNLKEINFDCNNIKELDPNLFNGLTNLKKINFRYNDIEEIDANIFNGLANLEKIYFQHNEIKKIPSNLLNGLVNLKECLFQMR